MSVGLTQGSFFVYSCCTLRAHSRCGSPGARNSRMGLHVSAQCYIQVCYALLVLAGIMADARRVPISVTSGIYLKEFDQAVMYEASVPLVYKSKLPVVDMAHLSLPEVDGFCERLMNDPKCVLFKWILQVDRQIGYRIKWLNASVSTEESAQPEGESRVRYARTLRFLGDAAHWCCGIVTSKQLRPLFTNQNVMSKFEQKLGEQMQEAFSEIDNMNLNMKNYSDQVERTFARIVDVGLNITAVMNRFQKQAFTAERDNNNKSLSLLQLSAHHVIRQLQILQMTTRLEILSQCRERKLPTFIVTLDKLTSDLVMLTQALREDGYELAIPTREMSKYLRLEIVECTVWRDEILINLKVPIRKLGSQWKLYEVMAVPFAWEKRVCSIQHETAFLAVNGDRSVSIQGKAERDCKPYDNPLCFVPREVMGSISSTSCTNRIFKGATIQELSSICVFKCLSGDSPLVNKISDYVYVLTHVAEPVSLKCRYSKNETIDLSTRKSLGAIEIEVPCDCELATNSQILVAESYPCQPKLGDLAVVHTIPAVWSKLKSLKITAQQTHESSSFDTLLECLDENWPSQVPHWNMSISAHQVPQAPVIERGPTEARSMFTTLSAFVHVIYFMIVSVIVIRNPHLIGIGTGYAVRAETVTQVGDEQFIVDLICGMVLIICFVLAWKLVVRVFKRCAAKGKEDPGLSMKTRRGLDTDDGLPKSLPVAEVDGKELRISLEWWQPSGTKETV